MKREDMNEMRRPRDWCKKKGIRIIDPDGWNYYRRTWFEEVTEEQFDKMVAMSTIESTNRPSQE